MVTLYNPSTSLCEMVYKGELFTVPAGGTVEVSRDVSYHWTTHVHQFLVEQVNGSVEKKTTKKEDK